MDTYKKIEEDGKEFLEVTSGNPTVEKIDIEYIRGRITAYEEAAVAKQVEADRYKALLVEYEKLEGLK